MNDLANKSTIAYKTITAFCTDYFSSVLLTSGLFSAAFQFMQFM